MNDIKRLKVILIIILLTNCSSDTVVEDITDNILVESMSIYGGTITNGGTSQLTVGVIPNNATNKTVTWSVSDTGIATVSETGLLMAVQNGNVIIKAAAQDGSNVFSEKEVTIAGVQGPPVLVESITIVGNDITDGNPQQLAVYILPLNADNKEVNWSVSDESIASINTDGLLTPKKNSTVTIMASSTDGSNVTGELSITISGIDESINGTIVATSQEILAAIANANPGENIYVRGGHYIFSSTIGISKSGLNGNLISLFGYPLDEERPQFDFSSMTESSSNRGLSLSGDFWHIKGIDVLSAGDNGMNISGDNNLIEFCTFSENADTGLQIGNGASNNTILNCDSFYNADSTIENADGFACKLDAGTGNKFIGCRAWQNLDDGWDGYLRGADNITTYYENCWAFKNGYLKSGAVSGGDGNGFKTGGSDNKILKHNAVYKNCIAAGNLVDGFDHNSNRGDVEIYNCSAYSNGTNINFSSTNIANLLRIKNTVSFAGGNNDGLNATSKDITNNSWQEGLSATTTDFVSVNIDLLTSPRNTDGSLPNIDFLRLNSTSDLIDKGVDVGLPFYGSAPDLGVFEYE